MLQPSRKPRYLSAGSRTVAALAGEPGITCILGCWSFPLERGASRGQGALTAFMDGRFSSGKSAEQGGYLRELDLDSLELNTLRDW